MNCKIVIMHFHFASELVRSDLANKHTKTKEKNMKSVLFTALISLATTAANADGFLCETTDGSLNVKVFNNTYAEDGTRNVAVMVVSDANVGAGNKTIARFTGANQTVSSEGAQYHAKVDLRYNDSGRKGELILGTKLGYLASIDLAVDFLYGQDMENGEQTSGVLTLTKRNGDEISSPMVCTRYLKN